MKKQLEERLKELKSEFEAGQKKLAELDAQQADLQRTLLRISGAIQVLQEELGKEEQPVPDDVGELVGSIKKK
jgi:chromosome segregation ATPase